MTLGHFIKEARLNKGMTQENLAFNCNVSKGTVSRWERDEVIPKINNLKDLSIIFDTTVQELRMIINK